MRTIRLGAVEVTRVVEWVGPITSVDTLFPDTPAHAWSELATEHWQPDDRRYRAAIQTWVLRDGHQTILIDTGVGNDRDRPQAPAFDHLNSDFLQRLADAGVRPADVDVVVNTHIHYDHVGWNTRRNGDGWSPTFPNATYLVPRRDYDYFRPQNAAYRRRPRDEGERVRFEGIRLVFDDSIAPVAASGQLQTWDDSHAVGPLRLELAPGHTPGSSVAWLDQDPGAVFVGDLVHTPLQLGRPGDACAFDLDPAAARRSRRSVLAEAGRREATLFPAHFAGRSAVRLAADEDNVRIREWRKYDIV